MKIKILGALIAAPMIVLGGAALSHDPLPPIDAISFNPPKCIVYIDVGGTIMGIQGTDGRVFVKFDVKNEPLTVSANCTVTAFSGDYSGEIPLDDDGFDCFVQINKFGHWHQILYGDPDQSDKYFDPEVRNKKRFRNGKAKLNCSGPYVHDQDPVYHPPGE